MRVFLGLLAAGFAVLTGPIAMAHMGEAHEVEGPAPTVEVIAHPDHVGGYNIEIQTTNFRWAPENASQEFVPGEGHAHLYVNGEKVARVYSEWFHLNTESLGLPAGLHEVTVDLNGNDHGIYLVQGVPVEASTTIEIVDGSSLVVPDGAWLWAGIGVAGGAVVGAGAVYFATRSSSRSVASS